MDIKGQEELYKILSDKKLYTKSFDDFKSQFSVPEGQAKLYQGMVDKGLYKKSQKDFTNQFFGAEKKKSNPTRQHSKSYGFTTNFGRTQVFIGWWNGGNGTNIGIRITTT